MTIHEWLAVFVVDGCNRAVANAAGPFERIAERAIRGTLLGLLAEANDRWPQLLGVEMQDFNVRELLKILLPLLENAAVKTSTLIDDWIVAVLKRLLAGDSPSAVMAALPPPS